MFVSDKIADKRLKICSTCEFQRKDFRIFGITILKRTPQCSLCGCPNGKGSVKIWAGFAKCDIDKW